MAVPARPVSGVPIESAWGQVVHDAIVAQDLQSGSEGVVVNNAVSATKLITFPRPFAAGSVPIVVASVGPLGTSQWVCMVQAGISNTQFTINVTTKTGTAASVVAPGVIFSWLAIGPRA